MPTSILTCAAIRAFVAVRMCGPGACVTQNYIALQRVLTQPVIALVLPLHFLFGQEHLSTSQMFQTYEII